MIHFLF